MICSASPRLVLFAIVFIAGIMAGTRWFGSSSSSYPSDAEPVAVSLDPPPNALIQFDGDLAGPPVVSPDGSRVVFAAARAGEPRRLWLRRLSDTEPRELPGTDGALFPFWDPTGRRIGFFTTNTLQRYDLATDTVRRVCEVDQARGGTWLPGDRIVLTPTFRSGLSIIDAAGGSIEVLTEVDRELHTSHRWPVAVGDEGVLFIAVSSRPNEAQNNALYYLDLESGGPPRRLFGSDYRAEIHGNTLLHVVDDVLLASRVDLDEATVSDEGVALARGVASDLSTWHGQFSAGNGVLVYQQRGAGQVLGYSWDVEADRITLFDSEGRPRTSYAEQTPMGFFSISPEADRIVAAVVSSRELSDLWLFETGFLRDIEGVPDDVRDEALRLGILNTGRRLTSTDGEEAAPVFAPDGTRVAYRARGRAGATQSGIYAKPISGGAETLIRDNNGGLMHPAQWTRDGRFLIAIDGTLLRSNSNNIYAIPILDEPGPDGAIGGEPIPLVVDDAANLEARVSPDGRWLAYSKVADGGNFDVYVEPFAPGWEIAPPDTRRIISNNGGRMPRWSEDGARLYYISPAGVLIEVPCDTTGDTFQYGSPSSMFQTPYDIGRTFEPAPIRSDGGRDFFFMDSDAADTAPISALLNWEALLDRDRGQSD